MRCKSTRQGILFSLIFPLILAACNFNGTKESRKVDMKELQALHTGNREPQIIINPGLVEIVTNAMEFKMEDEIPSGWVTLNYRNLSNETHFILIEKYPEGKGIEDARNEVLPPFQKGMDLINAGKGEEAMQAFGKLPDWFQEVKMQGGTGLIAPKSTATATIHLEPGNYLLECYVKMPNGIFHSMQGMMKEIKVTEENSGNQEPKADYKVEISSAYGIKIPDNITKGKHTFAVKFKDQKVHEHFLGHDVHLVWVDRGADLSKLNSWMNWSEADGFKTPVPQGFKFLGGMQEMDAGKTGYFTAELKAGTYAFISEVPDPKKKGMLKTFQVK